MIIGIFSVFLLLPFGMKIFIYQTQAAGVVGRCLGRQNWDVSHNFSSYPTFQTPDHVVPDCRIFSQVTLIEDKTILGRVP